MTREEFERVNLFLDRLVKTNKRYDEFAEQLKKAKTIINTSSYNKLLAGLKTVQNKIDEMIKIGINKKEIILLNDYVMMIDDLMQLAKDYMSHKANDGIRSTEYEKMFAVIDLFEFSDREKKSVIDSYSSYYKTESILGTRQYNVLQNKKGLIEDSTNPMVKMYGYLALNTRNPEIMDKYINLQRVECAYK